MQIFIYADLGLEPAYAYYKPLPAQIKQHFPEVICLDLDGYSEEFLVSQACQLVEQAEVCGICFSSSNAAASLGALLRLGEVIIRRHQESLVILRGVHTRLERLFSQRTLLTFSQNPTEEHLWQQLEKFYAK